MEVVLSTIIMIKLELTPTTQKITRRTRKHVYIHSQTLKPWQVNNNLTYLGDLPLYILVSKLDKGKLHETSKTIQNV